MSNVSRVTLWASPTEAKEIAELYWFVGLVPNLVSQSGVGKTSIVKQIHDGIKAQAGNAELWKALLNGLPAEDINGYNMVVNEKSGYKMKSFALDSVIPYGITDRVIILLFDEIDRANLPTLNAMTNLLREREAHGHTIHDNVMIISTMNGSTDIGTTEMPEALRARLAHIYIRPEGAEYRADFRKFCEDNKLPSELADYCEANPYSLAEIDELSAIQPRTRVDACKVFMTGRENGYQPDIIVKAMAGICGAVEARALFKTLNVPLTVKQLVTMTAEQVDKLDVVEVINAVKAEAVISKKHKAILNNILSGEQRTMLTAQLA